jgi:hypothetical protein
MSVSDTGRRPSIEVTAEAREALLAHVGNDPLLLRYVRIHVGRG